MEGLSIFDKEIVDHLGRRVTLKGCSLAASKLPHHLPTHNPNLDAFYDHRNVSFVGRPISLDTADAHWQRLAELGFNCVRLVVPWEAIEHSGPGLYDCEFFEYLRLLLESMVPYEIRAIIDCHQDVWSRLCGGSGAPGWTLELAGFDVTALQQAYAAHIHAANLDPADPPPAVWPTGYLKLAAATLFTLFFAGHVFAPLQEVTISQHASASLVFPSLPMSATVNVSLFLRKSYIAAYLQLSNHIAQCPALLGFEVMNEPSRGFIELHSVYTWNEMVDLAYWYCPTPLQAFALGAGIPQRVAVYKKSWPHPTRVVHYELLEPKKSVWKAGQCIWNRHGVWDWNEKSKQATILRSTYFEKHPATGQGVNFYNDFWFPFVSDFAKAVTETDDYRMERWFTFAGAIPNEFPPLWPFALRPQNLVYAPHFYDLHTLFSRTFRHITYDVQSLSRGTFPLKAIYHGHQGAIANYTAQVRRLLHPDLPSLFTEIGVTFEINLSSYHDDPQRKNRTFKDLKWPVRSLDALLSAMDSHGVSFALWNYNPENKAFSLTQPGDFGDGWCGEDFSFAVSLPDDTIGLRCREAIQRPYARKIAGVNPYWQFHLEGLEFTLGFRNSTRVNSCETEIYLPNELYGEGHLDIQTTDGFTEYNKERSLLRFVHSNTIPGYEHRLEVKVFNRLVQARRRRLTPLGDNFQVSKSVLYLAGCSAIVALAMTIASLA